MREVHEWFYILSEEYVSRGNAWSGRGLAGRRGRLGGGAGAGIGQGGQVRSVRTRLRGGLVVYICYVMLPRPLSQKVYHIGPCPPSSLFIATIVLESFIPAKCCIAPDIPTAIYKSGATIFPV